MDREGQVNKEIQILFRKGFIFFYNRFSHFLVYLSSSAFSFPSQVWREKGRSSKVSWFKTQILGPGCMHVCVYAKSLQSCPTFYDLTDHSLSGSSVHGILQARIVEWVTISFSTLKSLVVIICSKTCHDFSHDLKITSCSCPIYFNFFCPVFST